MVLYFNLKELNPKPNPQDNLFLFSVFLYSHQGKIFN